MHKSINKDDYIVCFWQSPGTVWLPASSSTRLIMCWSMWKLSGRFLSLVECGSTWVSVRIQTINNYCRSSLS